MAARAYERKQEFIISNSPTCIMNQVFGGRSIYKLLVSMLHAVYKADDSLHLPTNIIID